MRALRGHMGWLMCCILVLLVSCPWYGAGDGMTSKYPLGPGDGLAVNCGGRPNLRVGDRSSKICPAGQGMREMTLSCDGAALAIDAACTPIGIESHPYRRMVNRTYNLYRVMDLNIGCPTNHYIRGVLYGGHYLRLICEEMPGGTIFFDSDKFPGSEQLKDGKPAHLTGFPIKMRWQVRGFFETLFIFHDATTITCVDSSSLDSKDPQCPDATCEAFDLPSTFHEDDACTKPAPEYNEVCLMNGCPVGKSLNTNTTASIRCGPDLQPTSTPTCEPCPIGFFGPDNSSSCYPCINSYQDERGQVTCKPCDVGMHSPNNTRQLPCPLGHECPFTDCNRVPCSPGHEQPKVGGDACQPCHPGTFTNNTGTIQCSVCRRGKFAHTHGQRLCAPAQPGFFVPGDGATEQEPCPPGSYAGDPGMDACGTCSSTTVQPKPGRASCRACNPNTFRVSPAVEAECPPDMACSDCQAVPCEDTRDDFKCLCGSVSQCKRVPVGSLAPTRDLAYTLASWSGNGGVASLPGAIDLIPSRGAVFDLRPSAAGFQVDTAVPIEFAGKLSFTSTHNLSGIQGAVSILVYTVNHTRMHLPFRSSTVKATNTQLTFDFHTEPLLGLSSFTRLVVFISASTTNSTASRPAVPGMSPDSTSVPATTSTALTALVQQPLSEAVLPLATAPASVIRAHAHLPNGTATATPQAVFRATASITPFTRCGVQLLLQLYATTNRTRALARLNGNSDSSSSSGHDGGVNIDELVQRIDLEEDAARQDGGRGTNALAGPPEYRVFFVVLPAVETPFDKDITHVSVADVNGEPVPHLQRDAGTVYLAHNASALPYTINQTVVTEDGVSYSCLYTARAPHQNEVLDIPRLSIAINSTSVQLAGLASPVIVTSLLAPDALTSTAILSESSTPQDIDFVLTSPPGFGMVVADDSRVLIDIALVSSASVELPAVVDETVGVALLVHQQHSGVEVPVSLRLDAAVHSAHGIRIAGITQGAFPLRLFSSLRVVMSLPDAVFTNTTAALAATANTIKVVSSESAARLKDTQPPSVASTYCGHSPSDARVVTRETLAGLNSAPFPFSDIANSVTDNDVNGEVSVVVLDLSDEGDDAVSIVRLSSARLGCGRRDRTCYRGREAANLRVRWPGGAYAVVATDASGLSTTCHLRVELQDREAPSIAMCNASVPITVPLPASINSTGIAPNELRPHLGVSDNVDESPFVHMNFTRLKLGQHTVRVLARDASNNSVTCVMPVVVDDETLPTFAAGSCDTVPTLVEVDETGKARVREDQLPVCEDNSGYTVVTVDNDSRKLLQDGFTGTVAFNVTCSDGTRPSRCTQRFTAIAPHSSGQFPLWWIGIVLALVAIIGLQVYCRRKDEAAFTLTRLRDSGDNKTRVEVYADAPMGKGSQGAVYRTVIHTLGLQVHGVTKKTRLDRDLDLDRQHPQEGGEAGEEHVDERGEAGEEQVNEGEAVGEADLNEGQEEGQQEEQRREEGQQHDYHGQRRHVREGDDSGVENRAADGSDNDADASPHDDDDAAREKVAQGVGAWMQEPTPHEVVMTGPDGQEPRVSLDSNIYVDLVETSVKLLKRDSSAQARQDRAPGDWQPNQQQQQRQDAHRNEENDNSPLLGWHGVDLTALCRGCLCLLRRQGKGGVAPDDVVEKEDAPPETWLRGHFARGLLGRISPSRSLNIVISDLAPTLRTEAERYKHMFEVHGDYHPNIARLLFVLPEGDGLVFLNMRPEVKTPIHDFVLAQEFTNKQCQAFKLRLVTNVAKALVFIHAECLMIHEDLCLDNMLLGVDWELYISDFGMAACVEKREDSAAIGQRRIGLLGLTEVRQGCMSQKSDVWAFGAMLAELWDRHQHTALPPLFNVSHGYNSDLMLSATFYATYLRNHQHRPYAIQPSGMPRTIYEIVCQCMKPLAEDRPTMEEVVELLDDAAAALRLTDAPTRSTDMYANPPALVDADVVEQALSS